MNFYRLITVAVALVASLSGIQLARGQDVLAYGVLKEEALVQTNLSTPVVQSSNSYAFSAFVIGSNLNSITSAQVSKSFIFSGAPVLERNTNTGSFFFGQRFDTQEDLDLAYPSGQTYYFSITTINQGTKQPQVPFAFASYPTIPRITNYVQAQSIVASNAFTFRWDPFVGATTNDIIQLIILDGQTNAVYASPSVGEPGALNGQSLSNTIPAGTLQPGQSYSCTLVFARVTAANNFLNQIYYPGVPDIYGYLRRTAFEIRTAAVPTSTPSPLLKLLNVSAAGASLQFTSQPGSSYRLQGATNLPSTNWATLLTTNAAGTNVNHLDATATALPARYYRVISP